MQISEYNRWDFSITVCPLTLLVNPHPSKLGDISNFSETMKKLYKQKNQTLNAPSEWVASVFAVYIYGEV